VDDYAYAWTKDPIINGFIAQSGSASLGPSKPKNGSAWYAVSQKLGCGGAEVGAKTIDCMRGKSREEISKASATGSPMNSGFGPTVDEKIIFSDLAARKKGGNFIKRVCLKSSFILQALTF
jgi:cholinesterase